MASLTRILTRQLKLLVNEHKSPVAPINDSEFLSFTFRGAKLRWSASPLEDYKLRLRRLPGRRCGVPTECRFHVLAQYTHGWIGDFGISDYYRPIPEVHQWQRRRVRMCY